MPNPGQPPIDLRRETSPLYQANRPQATPGAFAMASGKQEPTEADNGSSIPATTIDPNSTSSTQPAADATTSATSAAPSPLLNAAQGLNDSAGTTSKLANTNSALSNSVSSLSRTQINATDDQTTINTPGASTRSFDDRFKDDLDRKECGVRCSGCQFRTNGRGQQLVVTFTVPTWIELANTNLTTGTKELIRETRCNACRLADRSIGIRQVATFDPRRDSAGRVFDLNVEWSVAPLMGAQFQVQVTEPLLKMSITGPDEVQFGQSAFYTVVIRNPGTGVAENVNVMLSEALGGERAPLGNVLPGEEKNIQVELIARSSGALDLSAGVSGDGNLQDNVSKKITVRRRTIGCRNPRPEHEIRGQHGELPDYRREHWRCHRPRRLCRDRLSGRGSNTYRESRAPKRSKAECAGRWEHSHRATSVRTRSLAS